MDVDKLQEDTYGNLLLTTIKFTYAAQIKYIRKLIYRRERRILK